MEVTYANCCVSDSPCALVCARGTSFPGVLHCYLYDYSGSGTLSNPNPSCLHGVTLDLVWNGSYWTGTTTDTCSRAVTVRYLCLSTVNQGQLLYCDSPSTVTLTRVSLYPDGSVLAFSCEPLVDSLSWASTGGNGFETCQGTEYFNVIAIISEDEFTYP